MLTNRAIVIEKDIDLARCQSNWQAIPELARKFKKHNPNGIVLQQSILAECSLNQLLRQKQESKQAFINDTPNQVSLSSRIDPNVLKPIQQQLSVALTDNDGSLETKSYIQMSNVILAQTYFFSGEYLQAIRILLPLYQQRPDVNSGYAYTLYLQAIVMKAISFEILNDIEKALESFNDIVIFVNGNPNLIERGLVEWAEKGLYRATLFALSDRCKNEYVPQTMNFIRAYQKTCSSQSNVWRIYKRLVVTRYSSKYLAEIYQAGDYLPPVDYKLTEEANQLSESQFSMAKEAYNHQLFSIEIMQLHTIYEKLIYAITKFPKSGQLHTLIIDFIERFANDFDLVGGTEAEKRGFVEVLNRASLRTFNSACVTRHLFHALVKLGDFEEAELALRTYLYLEGLESESLMDLSRTTAALASNSSIPVPPDYQIESLEIGHQNQLQDPQPWQETAENKIGVLTGAVKMYCQELAKGTEAVRMAELAIAVYNEETCHEFGPQVYRILGISFGFLASQTFDKERRPEYHEKALSALHKSLELDPQYWQTYYQLALQLAETRDILKAVTMISQSLQLNPTHLPSWHLLTLLCTCPVKEGMEQAVKTCELGLSESPTVIKDSWIDFSEEVSQYVLLQMTHTLLVARVYGREQASVAQENLFQTFGKILVPELIADSTSNLLHESISQGSARYGMVLSGSLGNIVEPSSGGSNSVINRGRSSSNASTFTTRSVSSFTGRKLHLAEMFDTASVKSGQGKSGSKPSLLDPKSLLRKDMSYAGTTGSLGSFQSTASSTHHTLLENSSGFSRPTTLAKLQHQRSCKMLCDLWLLSAESFLQHGKIDEALKAVGEAENVDWTTHAGVWCLLGRIRLVQKQYQKAIVAFEKGLVTKPSDVECRVWLAKTRLDLGDVEIAEGILENVTQENGWDNSLAWFYLGEIYRMTDRTERTKHCFFYALELESTTPIQSFTILPRFV